MFFFLLVPEEKFGLEIICKTFKTLMRESWIVATNSKELVLSQIII
jgi:hypothetical protein